MIGRLVLLEIVLISIVLCLSITSQSLWIDEAVTAYYASHDSLTSLLASLMNDRTAEPQKPFYIFFIWGWAKLFGTGEYALRAANIPFAILLVAALGWTSWRALGRPVLWVLFCFSPFVWFYMNEARPYIPMIACAAVSTGALMVYFAERQRYGKLAPWLCLSTLWIACGLHMLAVFLAPSLLVLALIASQQRNLSWTAILRDWAPALLIHAPFFFGLGVYFGWTLTAGAAGMREAPGFGNLGFSLYEFMGFMGLGPPRHVLRAEHNLQIFIPYWPWLFIGALSAAAFVSLSLLQIVRQQTNVVSGLVFALIAGLTLFLIASMAAEFRFWGRHLAAFFPLFTFIFVSAIGDLGSETRWKHACRVSALSLLCTWLISDARLWALPEYHKDDYRLATQAALDAARRSNGTIVWAADNIGARYYGIGFDEQPEAVEWGSMGKAVLSVNWSQTQVEEYLASADSPVVLVLSKADLYDAAKSWTTTVSKVRPTRVASPNAFNIYLFDKGPAEGLTRALNYSDVSHHRRIFEEARASRQAPA